MKLLDWLIDRTRAVSLISLWVAGAFMIATVFLIGAEIIVRKLGSGMVSGASEVGGYMLAICSVWAFSYTLLSRANIRFDVLYMHCGPRVRAIMDLIALIALGIFIYTVTYHAYAVLSTSINFNTHSTSSLSTPMWIPQSAWFLGLVFLCWTIFVLTARVFMALLQQDLATVRRLAGIAMTDEEVERETSGVPTPPAVQTQLNSER